jgi:hypothetical protein
MNLCVLHASAMVMKNILYPDASIQFHAALLYNVKCSELGVSIYTVQLASKIYHVPERCQELC